MARLKIPVKRPLGRTRFVTLDTAEAAPAVPVAPTDEPTLGNSTIASIAGLQGALDSKEPAGTAAAAVAAHVAEADPHPQYLTAAEGAALVEDAIVDGVTTKAPSQNAVFDALAGKLANGGLDALGDYVDDAAAALGGIAVGAIYRNGSQLMVRIA